MEGEKVPAPAPADKRLKVIVLALDMLAGDENQPLQIRRDARLIKYFLCFEHKDDDEKDWSWVIEKLAPEDSYLKFVLKKALDVMPEPDCKNLLLLYKLVKADISDC